MRLSREPEIKTDQRTAVRHLCSWPIVVLLLADPAWERLRMRVRDVSVTGIGLLGTRPLEVGARLALDWNFGPASRWKTLQARVVHVTPQQGEQVLIGCQFDIPLDETDLSIVVWDMSRMLAFNA
jgi:PilZ domain